MSKPFPKYLEFAVASNFSFLRGASHPEELMVQAVHVGLAGIGLCDRNSVAGVVRAHAVRREQQLPLRYHPGTRLVFSDGTPDILAYPHHRAGWGRLCRLLTRGNLRAEKGDCILFLEDLLEFAEGLELVVMERSTLGAVSGAHCSTKCCNADPGPRLVWDQGNRDPASAVHRLRAAPRAGNTIKVQWLRRLHDAAPGRVRLAASMLYRGNDRTRLAKRAALAREAGVPLIAVNDVLYHHPDRRPLADVVTCIREHLTLESAGRKLAVNAERYLKPPQEMARLFREAPEAIEETQRLSDALTFSLDELQYEYPDEMVAGFATPQEALVHLTLQGAAQRYPDGIPNAVRNTLDNEFALIASRQYAPYFLTVYDIVRYARSIGILCQGRGSAANSTVCYCLGVTSVDPVKEGLLFERFISTEREEPPDIDIDFEHERREEVIQYIYDKYTRQRTGIAGTVISYRGRSAIREVGKVFGLSEDTIGALSSSIWGMGGGSPREADLQRIGIDVNSARMKKMRALVQEIQQAPRHLSQHVGGFVITRSRLDEVVPIANAAMEDRTFVEWNKDDLDDLGILKVDVLGLGMLTCIRKAFELAEKHYGEHFRLPLIPPRFAGRDGALPPANEAVGAFELSTVPQRDKAVYRMLCRADSIGVFQVESRAQMSMLPRLKPQEFYDLVIEVAIVRPGPIQGNMVHPYLQRRERLRKTGEEPEYPSPAPGKGDRNELKNVLKKTLGVPLFQEQAMKIAIVAGGFTPGEADKLRRAMATFKRTGTIGTFRNKMIAGMLAKGYPREFAERCFSQIEGFGEYGFPESHAASFALLVYASAWLKCRYPDVFAAALLNSQPMGFYASAQIVRDVREHGVEMRPVDVNFSDYDSTLEPGPRAAEHLHERHAEMRGDIRTTHAIRLGLREVKGLNEEDAKRIMEVRSCFTSPRLRGEVDPPKRSAGGSGEGAFYETSPPTRSRSPSASAIDLPLKGGGKESNASREREAPYTSVRDFWLRTGLPPRVIERLADADAFGSLGLSRRQALWAAKALGRVGDKNDDLPLFATRVPGAVQHEVVHRRPGIPVNLESWTPDQQCIASRCTASGERSQEPVISLPAMSLGEEVVNDYRFLKLSLRAHPASFLRADLTRRGIVANDTLRQRKTGERVAVSGLVTCRQRPGSAAGVVFLTIEDESSLANIIVWPKVFERFRPLILGARYIAAAGPMQEEEGVIHVVAERLEDLTPLLARLTEVAGDLDVPARGTAHAPTRRGR